MATKTTENFEEAYKHLNPQQKAAVDATEGPVMVLAGPGTGKTQTLSVRIGKILQSAQLDPWNILCLTFTEAAAAEMRERLAHMIGSPAYSVRISTFHSFCNDIIQEHPEIFALAPNWQPLTDVERVEMVEELIDSLPGTSPLKPMGNPYLYLRDCVGHIQALKQEDISPEAFSNVLRSIEAFITAVAKPYEVFIALKPKDRTDGLCEDMFTQIMDAADVAKLALPLRGEVERIHADFGNGLAVAEGARDAGKVRTKFKNDIKRFIGRMQGHLARQQELAKVYAKYTKALLKKGRYDFEDMIIMVVAAFKKDADLLASYQEQFQYILVDEFQDTNGAQNEVVGLLGSFDEQPNIFVVGDDKQSIYRFQGASLANMVSFYERYKQHVQVISLAENYRSSQPILSAAASVAKHNKQSLVNTIPNLTDDLTCQAAYEPKLIDDVVVEFPDQEIAAIARRIQALLDAGAPADSIAVLARFNKDARDIAQGLRQYEIPTSLAAGENALAQSAIMQWVAVWRYLSNPAGYDHLLADIVQFDWWGVDSVDGLRAIHAAGVSHRSLTQAFSSKTFLGTLGLTNASAFEDMMKHLATWHSLAAGTTVPNAITTMLDESGWLTGVLHAPAGLHSLEHMSTVLDEAKQASKNTKQFTLQGFVELLDLHVRHSVPMITPPHRLAKNAVAIMTAHKAKGQEFDHVFITRFIHGRWGGARTPNVLPLPHGLVRGDLVAEGENDEDERRLFYVAVTRAKRSLTITRARMSESNRPSVPSRFAQELPTDVIQPIEEAESTEDSRSRLATIDLVTPLQVTTPLRTWLEQVLSGYVMSVTHLNNYLEDPQLFYVRNVLRMPSVRTTHQAMGTAAHNALTSMFAVFQKDDKLPPQSFLLDQFESYLEAEDLAKQEYTDTLAVGRKQLAAYYDQYRDQFVKNTIGEYDFRRHNVRVGEALITGKIDKIELLNDKQVNVVDYKTGSPETGLAKIKPGGDYHRQIVFYKLLCDTAEQFPYEMVSGEIDFIKPDKKGQFVKKKIEVTDKDMSELTDTIKRVWKEIHELAFLQTPIQEDVVSRR